MIAQKMELDIGCDLLNFDVSDFTALKEDFSYGITHCNLFEELELGSEDYCNLQHYVSAPVQNVVETTVPFDSSEYVRTDCDWVRTEDDWITQNIEEIEQEKRGKNRSRMKSESEAVAEGIHSVLFKMTDIPEHEYESDLAIKEEPQSQSISFSEDDQDWSDFVSNTESPLSIEMEYALECRVKEEAEPVRRKRGRPRKTPVVKNSLPEPIVEVSRRRSCRERAALSFRSRAQSKLKNKARGRPRKRESKESSSTETDEEQRTNYGGNIEEDRVRVQKEDTDEYVDVECMYGSSPATAELISFINRMHNYASPLQNSHSCICKQLDERKLRGLNPLEVCRAKFHIHLTDEHFALSEREYFRAQSTTSRRKRHHAAFDFDTAEELSQRAKRERLNEEERRRREDQAELLDRLRSVLPTAADRATNSKDSVLQRARQHIIRLQRRHEYLSRQLGVEKRHHADLRSHIDSLQRN